MTQVVHGKHSPAPVGPPTFLVGAERSGTTLLRLMLDAHPELAFRQESEFFVDQLADDGSWPDLETYYETLRTRRFAGTPPLVDRSLDYPSLIRSFLEQKRLKDGKPRVGATVHKHFDRLLRIWPDARFIHLVRDGRDVALSCARLGWHGSPWSAASRWIAAERLWDRMRAELPESQRHEIRYEDLVSEPTLELSRICEFIGIEYEPAMLEYPNHTTYSPPTKAHVAQWRRRCSPRELRLLEGKLGPLLADRGYELSSLPPIHPRGPARKALQVTDRLALARARARRLGGRLWLESVLATRVGPELWRESVRERIHRTINAQLE